MVDVGDLATWAAAVIAGGAAGIAWRQNREARKARLATEAQAIEAARSSAAAEAQAIEAAKARAAAEEQVALMRADRDERDGPVFSVSARPAENTNFFAAEVVMRMNGGRALRSLTITASGDYVQPKGLYRFTDPSGGVAAGTELTIDDIRNGRDLVFYVSAEDGYVGSTIDLELTCHERGGEERTWQRHYACTIVPRPETPRSWPTFTPIHPDRK